MTNEYLLKGIARFFRFTPHFRGKKRIGDFIFYYILSVDNWQEPAFFIKMKDGTYLYVDIRSRTHITAFWTGQRDWPVIKLLMKNLPDNAVFFDVGANIGYYSLPIAKCLSSQKVKVFAFEPVSGNYESLEKGINKNNIMNVHLQRIALSNQEGEMEIAITEKGKSSNAVMTFDKINDDISIHKETIKTTTLNSLKDGFVERCDIVKIDIEGAEIFFMQGGMEFIEKYRPVIYGEFNSFFLNRFGYSFSDVWNLIKPLKYYVYKEYGRNGGRFKKVENISEHLADVLLIPIEKVEKNEWKM